MFIFFFIVNFFYLRRRSDEVDNLKNKRLKLIGDFLNLEINLSLNLIEKKLSSSIKFLYTNILKFGLQNFQYLVCKFSFFDSSFLTLNLIRFFNRHRGSQLFDDINIFSDLTHRRKISPFGFGGLLNKKGNLRLRDIHPSQYGRVCLIETVEGESAGLIFSLV